MNNESQIRLDTLHTIKEKFLSLDYFEPLRPTGIDIIDKEIDRVRLEHIKSLKCSFLPRDFEQFGDLLC